jgi:hypothetical protein
MQQIDPARARLTPEQVFPSHRSDAGVAASDAASATVVGALLRLRSTVSRIGWLAFAFFLLKGALWLAAPYILALIVVRS